MKQHRLSIVLLVAIGVVQMAGSGAASADSKKSKKELRDEAQQFYAEGTKAYNLGDFAKAIENYKAAYNALPEPVFLYNIAQAYRLSNDLTQAVFFYKSFLRNMPNATNKAEVEGRIREIEDQIAKLKQTTTQPPNDTVAPGQDPPRDTTPPSDPPPDKPVVIVPPDQVADSSAAGVENQTVPEADLSDRGGGSKPIYKKWWFWAGIGAVAAGAAVVVVMSSGGEVSAPDSHFGNETIF